MRNRRSLRFSEKEALSLGLIKKEAVTAKQTRANTILRQGNSIPQDTLTALIRERFPSHNIQAEFKALDNRKFMIDIAFPDQKTAIEVDGWQYHGKHLSSHKKDRVRQNLLVANGWRVLRFTVSQIKHEKEGIVSMINDVLMLDVEQSNEIDDLKFEPS